MKLLVSVELVGQWIRSMSLPTMIETSLSTTALQDSMATKGPYVVITFWGSRHLLRLCVGEDLGYPYVMVGSASRTGTLGHGNDDEYRDHSYGQCPARPYVIRLPRYARHDPITRMISKTGQGIRMASSSSSSQPRVSGNRMMVVKTTIREPRDSP